MYRLFSVGRHFAGPTWESSVEPTDACNESNAGKEVRVPYTADYYFYKRK